MKKLCCVLLMLPLLIACAAGQAGQDGQSGEGRTVSEKDLLHHRFVLAAVNGKAFTPTFRTPEISFNEGMTLGGRVCNSFGGPAELKNGRLSAPQMASTMMLCPDPELNKLEQDFYAMLRKGADVSLDATGHTLTLRSPNLTLEYTLRDLVQ